MITSYNKVPNTFAVKEKERCFYLKFVTYVTANNFINFLWGFILRITELEDIFQSQNGQMDTKGH